MPAGNYVEITIEDHGVGISKEHLGRIFDPYFSTKQKGSGLGLATAYSIVRSHDGHISAESELGVGTTLRIYLPASSQPAPKKEEGEVEAPLRGKGRILAMDDEEMIRELLSKTLSLAGYEVELTADGAEAIEAYRKAREAGQTFDAVIMDLTIPGGVGGKEAIKKLLEIDPGAKVIVSSGYSTDPIMADCKKYGFRAGGYQAIRRGATGEDISERTELILSGATMPTTRVSNFCLCLSLLLGYLASIISARFPGGCVSLPMRCLGHNSSFCRLDQAYSLAV